MAMPGNGVIGVRREDKNKWERRVPVTPEQVRALVREGIRVLVQPSNIRVFPNEAYEEAGAEITEDISPASTILAVKEVPIHLLIPQRTYLFFSHTIKAQPANMPLLDALLEKKIRLVDYECITAGGLRGAKRLVAFGRFAGVAGMIDYLRGLGERFLSQGFSTPFLGIAAMYTYPTLAAAFEAVRVCGESIARYGLPAELCPFTAVFTGDGNVSRGAQEVFALLPVKWVAPEDLHGVVENAKGRGRTHCVYACVAHEQHMARKRTGPAPATPLAADTPTGGLLMSPASSTASARDLVPDPAFNKAEYREHPELYEPIFHEFLAPYTSILVNCMYWEARFPRLLTIKQTQRLAKERRLRMVGVCDITCDFQGSVEFLKEFTSIEKPFYIYDVEQDKVVYDLEAPGLLYHAVDHLPSECPRDASEHFGNCLLPFLPAIARSDASKPLADQTDIPVEIRGAVVTHDGQLSPNFSYISALRAAADRAQAGRGLRARRQESFVSVELIGHLFDTGIINKILDTIEHENASARIVDFHVGKDRDTPTEMQLQVFAPAKGHAHTMPTLLERIVTLASSMGVAVSAGGDGSYLHDSILGKSVPRSIALMAKRILVLGSGYVSGPLVEYLLRRPNNQLTVASMIKPEAEKLAAGRSRVSVTQLDVFKEYEKLDELVRAHDVVVSLVPAPCHPAVAKLAIAAGKHMVTASYVAPEMRELHEMAKVAGVTIMNEAGLDPGIDHMSAKKMIDDALTAGGNIVSFSSVCGGLPAPEAANNPLGYKFSWSPRGVLTATRNTARYLRDGHVVEVPGHALLASAAPFRVNPAFALECIPNRDSMPYADKYGIAGPQLQGMFRGTLRYAGFCAHMHALTALGMLDLETRSTSRSASLRDLLAAAVGVNATDSDDTLFEAALTKIISTASAVVDAQVAALAAVAPQFAEWARSAAASSSNASLTGDIFRKAELRKFLEWCGFFSASTAPLRGGDAGDGVTGKKWEDVVEEQKAAGAVSSAAPVSYVPLDTLVAILTSKPEMSYASGERDMALMQHELVVAYPDGSRKRHTSTLVEYANAKGQTAMARTVGLTAAIAAQIILDGTVKTHGVLEPTTRDWYIPMLEALEEEGIAMKETVSVL